MTADSDSRSARRRRPRALDRRTLLAQALGVASVGALAGSQPGPSAGANGAPAQVAGRLPGIALAQGMRLVVTGHDAEGRSYIVRDERVTTAAAFPNLFRTTGDDPFGAGPEPAPRTLHPTDSPPLEPAPGGANFHFVALPPTTAQSLPVWHRTETVDMNVLLGGELVLMLDREETTLHPGDVVIQRNTSHAWRNPTDAPVYWAAVLVPIRQRA